jgi:hypothetical protein
MENRAGNIPGENYEIRCNAPKYELVKSHRLISSLKGHRRTKGASG